MALRSPAVISMSISRPGLGARHLAGQVEQVVGLLAHGRDRHHDLVAAADGAGHVVGDGAHPLGVGDRGAAELHHQQGHGAPRVPAGSPAAPGALSAPAGRRPAVSPRGG